MKLLVKLNIVIFRFHHKIQFVQMYLVSLLPPNLKHFLYLPNQINFLLKFLEARVLSITVTTTKVVITIERTVRTATTTSTTTTRSFPRRTGTDRSGGRINLRQRKPCAGLISFFHHSPTRICGRLTRLVSLKYSMNTKGIDAKNEWNQIK
jgi:hypothetical protein